jgi:hypothetical protein
MALGAESGSHLSGPSVAKKPSVHWPTASLFASVDDASVGRFYVYKKARMDSLQPPLPQGGLWSEFFGVSLRRQDRGEQFLSELALCPASHSLSNAPSSYMLRVIRPLKVAVITLRCHYAFGVIYGH